MAKYKIPKDLEDKLERYAKEKKLTRDLAITNILEETLENVNYYSDYPKCEGCGEYIYDLTVENATIRYQVVGVQVEYDQIDLLESDEITCGLCGEIVPEVFLESLVWPDKHF